MSNASVITATAASLSIGDTITINAREGVQQADGSIAEVEITKTILIEEIVVISDNLWAHGPVVATTSAHTAFHLGRHGRAHIGKVVA